MTRQPRRVHVWAWRSFAPPPTQTVDFIILVCPPAWKFSAVAVTAPPAMLLPAYFRVLQLSLGYYFCSFRSLPLIQLRLYRETLCVFGIRLKIPILFAFLEILIVSERPFAVTSVSKAK